MTTKTWVPILVLAATAVAEAQSLSRGPYLQQGSENSVIVRWRTSSATNSRVRIGTALANPLPTVVDDGTSTAEHEVKVTGLAANTRYYYSVGSTTATLAGPDANHFFVTSPLPGAAKPTRVWVLGDAGTKDANQRAVRDAYYGFTGTRHTDLWLMLGDNAYNDGTDSEYQAAVFDMYPAMLRKSVLWSTLGNHDGHSADSGSQTGPYYDLFTFPKSGEAGGLASGTEAYYSFDYGNIHFICLDSYDTSRSATGAMATWARNDANATTRDWIIAFWHHPPYSKGSHDSDSESALREMRANFNPILEAAGVDLVLCGHSHSYERSFLLDGHYGDSSTFSSTHKVDGGSGRDPAPYSKPSGTVANEGAVYVVAGSSGKISGGSLDHPAMFISLNNLGSMVIDVDGNRLDAKFIRENGSTADSFSIVKGGGTPALPAVTVTASDASASETGPASGTFRITRTGSTASSLTVAFALSGTAANGTDYDTLTSPVTIAAGSASADVTVTPKDDAAVESNETVVLTLTAGASYTVGAPSSAQVTISDDDATADADSDGLPDAWETTHFGNTTSQNGSGDPDADGLTNAREFAAGTDPMDPDTDGDGMPDGWEDGYGLNPTSGADASSDLDSDGLTNLQEYQGGSDPTNAASPGSATATGAGREGTEGWDLCGATGAEALLVLLLAAFRRRRPIRASTG
jgi:hypothetical protein